MLIDQDEVDTLVADGYTLNDVLAHYGVPGMKWGKRKNGRNSKEIQPDDAEDHVRARTLQTVAKTKGVRKLQNKDLEDLNKRLNLEQNYAGLTQKTKQKTAVAVGANWFSERVKGVGNTLVDETLKANAKVIVGQSGLLLKPSK